jgi:hypothetical protein
MSIDSWGYVKMQCQSDDREDDEGLREGPQEKNGMDDSVIV